MTPECEVRELIRECCNDTCPEWSTCTLAEIIMKTVINLFDSYKPGES